MSDMKMSKQLKIIIKNGKHEIYARIDMNCTSCSLAALGPIKVCVTVSVCMSDDVNSIEI